MTANAIPMSPVHHVILSAAALLASPEFAAIRDEGFYVSDSSSLDDHVHAALQMYLQDRVPADTPADEYDPQMGRVALEMLGAKEVTGLNGRASIIVLDALLEAGRPELLKAMAECITWSKSKVEASATERSAIPYETLQRIRREIYGKPWPRSGDEAPPEPTVAEAPTPPKPPLHDGGMVVGKSVSGRDKDIAIATVTAQPKLAGFNGAEIAAAQARLHKEWREAQDRANKLSRAMTAEGLLKALQAARAEQSTQAGVPTPKIFLDLFREELARDAKARMPERAEPAGLDDAEIAAERVRRRDGWIRTQKRVAEIHQRLSDVRNDADKITADLFAEMMEAALAGGGASQAAE